MFGLGKKKKFEHHQKLLFQCQRFAEFVMAIAQENADADQIEFWDTKLGRITKVRDASLRKQGIIDKNDEFFLEALKEKSEEAFYKTDLSKQQSFDDSFQPDDGWENYLQSVRDEMD